MLGSKRKLVGPVVSDSAVTLISAGTRIVGDVYFIGQLDIEGVVEGNVVAESGDACLVRVLGEGAVQGTLRAPEMLINATVCGDIYCSQHLELAERARVNGNVFYRALEIARGAEVTGGLRCGDVAVIEGRSDDAAAVPLLGKDD